ncbi:MAG: glycosyltransferase family 2 protein [Rhizomicrobium sp.]
MASGVTAIVVTFNRKDLLAQCLDAILAQSVAPDRIIVVDNGSSDGTREAMQARLANAVIDYRRLEENLGGAGGFNAGVASALETGASWFWLMDDDVAPTPDCLWQLLKRSDVSECLHPRKFGVDGREVGWEKLFEVQTVRFSFIPNLSFANGKDICFVNSGCFEGMLISRRVVDAIGLPDAKYFVAFDDTIYGIKASVHTNIAYVRDARIRKLLVERPDSAWKTYYTMRNKFYLHCDAVEALEIPVRNADRVIFHTARAIELLQFVAMGPSFARAAWRGWRHGIGYLRSRRRLVRRAVYPRPGREGGTTPLRVVPPAPQAISGKLAAGVPRDEPEKTG